MKKVLLVLFVAAFATFAVKAQETKFGVKGGLTIPMFSGDDAEGVDSKMGFHVGGYVSLGLSEKLAVQPELLLTMAGSKGEEMGVEIKTNMTYLDIPIMVKYYVAEGINLQVGPRIGFLMSAKADPGGVDIKDFFKGTNLGLGLGAAYEMENGLNIGARYTLGLANIVDADEADFKLGGVEISVGFSF